MTQKKFQRSRFLVISLLIITLPVVILAIILIGAQPRLSSRAAPALPPPELWTGWTYEGSYSLYVDEPVALVDQPVTIRVENLEPKQPLTLRLSTVDPKTQQVWESFATFEADHLGMIDAATSQPLYGTYQGIDAMGLFWSMLPVGAADPESLFLLIRSEGLTLTLTAEAGSKTLITTTLKRLVTTELIEQEVLDDGLAGKLFYPPAGGRIRLLSC